MAAQRRGVGEGLGPPAERFVGGDGHTGLFLPFRQNLEQELGAAAVEFHVAELIDLCDIAPRWRPSPGGGQHYAGPGPGLAGCTASTAASRSYGAPACAAQHQPRRRPASRVPSRTVPASARLGASVAFPSSFSSSPSSHDARRRIGRLLRIAGRHGGAESPPGPLGQAGQNGSGEDNRGGREEGGRPEIVDHDASQDY